MWVPGRDTGCDLSLILLSFTKEWWHFLIPCTANVVLPYCQTSIHLTNLNPQRQPVIADNLPTKAKTTWKKSEASPLPPTSGTPCQGFRWTNHPKEGQREWSYSEIPAWTTWASCNPAMGSLHVLQATVNSYLLGIKPNAQRKRSLDFFSPAFVIVSKNISNDSFYCQFCACRGRY